MSERSCIDCEYLKIGWCEARGITPYPPDKTSCGSFAPKPIKLDCVAKNKETAKQTVFDKITESVETLAEKLVYYASVKIGRETRLGWLSTITGDRFYYLRDEALAATIEGLKKEYKG